MIKNNVFNIIVVFILMVIFIFSKKTTIFENNSYNKNQISIFVQDNCGHCKELKQFLNSIENEKYNIVFYNLTENVKNYNLLVKYANKYNIPFSLLGTPIMFYDNSYILSFSNTENEKNKIIDILEQSLLNNNKEKEEIKKQDSFLKNFVMISLALPFINFYNIVISLLLLSIGVLFNNKHKSKLLLLCFFLSSVIITFLFLIEWLDPFLVARWSRLFNLIIGLLISFYSIKYFYITTYNKKKNIFENSKNKLSNFLILSSICLSFIINITRFTKNETLFINFLKDASNLNLFIKYFIFFIASFLSSVGIVLVAFIFYKLLESLLFKNNKNNINYKNIFNVVLFCISIYLVFIINY